MKKFEVVPIILGSINNDILVFTVEKELAHKNDFNYMYDRRNVVYKTNKVYLYLSYEKQNKYNNFVVLDSYYKYGISL